MKLFVAILLGMFVGGAAGIGMFYHHELTNFKVASWKYPPIVVDCTFGALKKERIASAINYWDELDHKVGFVEINPSSKVCSNDSINGFIIIKNAELHWPVLGNTTRYGNSIGKIDSATIELNVGDANLPRLLEHELGHAFGYRHFDIEGHIMHSDYGLAGWDFFH